jgi:hypothetical protein
MFQSIKRASYISQNNFQHWNTQDGVGMHLWLQKNGWPANELVDWFMRVTPKSDYSSKISFELYLTSQYDWVSSNDIESLQWLYEKVNTSEFKSHDKDNLTAWLKTIYRVIQTSKLNVGQSRRRKSFNECFGFDD